MTELHLAKLLEHGDWANDALLEACSKLPDELLDARPLPGTTWSVRRALHHLVTAQRGYLELLTLPPEERRPEEQREGSVRLDELRALARASGAGLRAFARRAPAPGTSARLRTTDGYLVEPWVVLVQVVNHATEHRRQVADMLRALGVAAPVLDGWAHGVAVGALVPLPPRGG